MAIILTGMHRSGTSMFARFMHESGICMGENFYLDKTANRYGHYEDLDFLNLQRNELSRHFKGEDWLIYDDFIISDDFISQAGEIYLAKAAKNQSQDWGWKDPRTTLFMDFWQNIDPEIRTVFMVRHPDEVLNSLCRLLKTRWSHKEKSKYLKTYAYYNHAILKYLKKQRNQKTAVVNVKRLIENTEEVLEKVNTKISTDFDYRLFNALFDVHAISAEAFIPSIFMGKQLDEARAAFDALKPYFI
jgi:hypothetical protein